MAEKNFEKKRQMVFECSAQKALEKIDPETCLLASTKYPDRGSVHVDASGWNIRDSLRIATPLAMTGREKQAWKIIGTVLDYQDTNPDSMTRGNFRHHTGWDFARDPNALSFMVPHLWYVHKHRGKVMPAALRKRIEAAMRLAVPAIDAHRGGHLSYSNIILLNLASRLCIADALDLPGLRALAGWEWEEWRNYILRIGFLPEHNAPGYTCVQLDALGVMLACRAPEALHAEIRNFMRHIIAEAAVNYHEKIGLLTGPRSRGTYAVRGRASMDTIFHFVLGAPEPPGGCNLWLGAPLSPEDLLPRVRGLALPRTNVARSPAGCSRTNHLDRAFALGSVNAGGRLPGSETPVFLAFQSRDEQCGIPFIPARSACRHASVQQAGKLVAASLWTLPRRVLPDDPDAHLGRFSNLNTGNPSTLVTGPKFRPGFTVNLGRAGTVAVRDENGRARDIAPGKTLRLPGTGLLLETESISAGLRFFGAGGGGPVLRLRREGDQLHLEATGTRRAVNVSEIEKAVFCAFCLEVAPGRKTARFIPRPPAVTRRGRGWGVRAAFARGAALELEIDARPAVFYRAGDVEVTPNMIQQEGGA